MNSKSKCEGRGPWRSTIATLVALFAVGCTSNYRVGLQLERGNRAIVNVLGEQVYVEVDNRGPGPIDIRYEDEGGSPPTRAALTHPSVTATTLYGTHRIVIETRDAERASVEIRMRGADGYALEQLPAPVAQ